MSTPPEIVARIRQHMMGIVLSRDNLKQQIALVQEYLSTNIELLLNSSHFTRIVTKSVQCAAYRSVILHGLENQRDYAEYQARYFHN